MNECESEWSVVWELKTSTSDKWMSNPTSILATESYLITGLSRFDLILVHVNVMQVKFVMQDER